MAAHKAPAFWCAVEDMPMTPTGKVQKFVLRDWAADGTLKFEATPGRAQA